MSKYIFNLETTKIELHFEKSQYDALSDDDKRLLKGSFLWSNRGKCWVSRAKEPNLWRATEVAKKLGFTEEQREGERITYAEQLERQTERAEERANRYDGYAGNAAKRGEQLQSGFNSFRGDIAFFTQPNINSSSGRAFTNYRNRLYERYSKGFEEYRKSDYFKGRAQTARETASQAQFNDPAYLDRRIKECKKEIRDREKNIIYYEKILCAVENGEDKKWRGGEVVTIESVKSQISRELELIEKAMDKQGYLENCLDECGGLRFNAEIAEIVKGEEKKRPPQPFKVGERFETIRREYPKAHSFKCVVTKIIYEIIKASDTTIQLRPVGTNDKPIIRKPSQRFNGEWVFSIDDIYGNMFFKEAEVATCQ